MNSSLNYQVLFIKKIEKRTETEKRVGLNISPLEYL